MIKKNIFGFLPPKSNPLLKFTKSDAKIAKSPVINSPNFAQVLPGLNGKSKTEIAPKKKHLDFQRKRSEFGNESFMVPKKSESEFFRIQPFLFFFGSHWKKLENRGPGEVRSSAKYVYITQGWNRFIGNLLRKNDGFVVLARKCTFNKKRYLCKERWIDRQIDRLISR